MRSGVEKALPIAFRSAIEISKLTLINLISSFLQFQNFNDHTNKQLLLVTKEKHAEANYIIADDDRVRYCVEILEPAYKATL